MEYCGPDMNIDIKALLRQLLTDIYDGKTN